MSRALQEVVHPERTADPRANGQLTPEVRRLEVPDSRRWRALAVTQLAAFMVLLDVSIVTVALPSIERDLAVSAVTAQWVISGYALTLGLALVPAGVGGGMVTSPNVTLTLENVPVRMAGAASGALQTVQRIGAAIGSATLATIFYHVLNQTDHDYQAAASDALLGTCAFILLTLLIALGEVTWRRHHLGNGLGDQP